MYDGGTRTKSRRREKFVEFYPVSRYSVLHVFFLSLSLFVYCARLCRDDDDDDDVLVLGTFSSLAFEFLKR